MDVAIWSAVDNYFSDTLLKFDKALYSQILKSNAEAGLPAIDVSAPLGKFLNMMVFMTRAKRVLEIGTLGGYSTVWMAKALAPGGRLISLEMDPLHAETARANVAKAGVSDLVEIRVGKALDSLAKLEQENLPTFDLVFIDADKANNPNYFAWALKWTRKGSVIIVDNVVRKGAVIDPESKGEGVQGTRALHEMISNEPRVTATALQTVGTKGWDGFVMAIVVADL